MYLVSIGLLTSICLRSAVAHDLVMTQQNNWVISNQSLKLEVQQQGAVISKLYWKGCSSPNWLATKPEHFSPSNRFGHYLCFDRWGPVTKQEAALGIPYHGAAGLNVWSALLTTDRAITLTTQLPVSLLQATRTIRISESSDVILFANHFYNPTTSQRDYEAVEHVTLSAYWYEADLRLVSNASTGIVQLNDHVVNGSEFPWPKPQIHGETWDVSRDLVPEGYTLISLKFPKHAKWGWITLHRPSSDEILGYVWPLADYPWLNLWWSKLDGHIIGQAIEPGTAGPGRPLPELVRMGTMLNRPVYHSMTAKSQSRTYKLWCFVLRDSQKFGDVRKVTIEHKNNVLIISGDSRQLALTLP